MEIITILGRNISLFLCRNNIISEQDLEIYQYGFETIISTVLGFMITLLIGFILDMQLLSVLYYVIFVFLRQLTGGYHADTYLKCNTIFAIITFITLGITKLLHIIGKYSLIFLMILTIFSLLIIWRYAPVENPNKPLDSEQIMRNHKMSLLLSVSLSLLSFILYFAMAEVSLLITLTIFCVSLLIIMSKLKKGGV
ncbi:MAG: accessory gene regulator B family protein [Ruminococcus sp.]|nr:accessory gene regulator B family protein [Ruminococcus sp.]